MKQKMLWPALLVLTVLVTSLPVSDAEFTLTILHTNDFRARYEELDVNGEECSTEEAMENQCFGGIARLAAAVKTVREQSPNPTLLLDAGDRVQGTIYSVIYRLDITSTFMNLLGYDAMALGNHEFDFRLTGTSNPDLGIMLSGLDSFLKSVDFGVVSANIDSSNEPLIDGLFNKSVVLTVGDQRVGIIGYTTEDTEFISSPGPNLQFLDIVTSVQAEVSRLQDEGVDIIIALGHAGAVVDRQVAEIQGVDVVIGGQSKTFLYNGDPPSIEEPEGPYPIVVTQGNGGTAVTAQCFELGKYVCRLDVTFNDQGDVMSTAGNPVLLDSSVTPDPETQLALSNPWMAQVTVLRGTVVASTLVDLEGDEEQCRVRECNMGNFIADGVLRLYLDSPGEMSWNSISIVLINGGAIGRSIDRGEATFADVLQVLRFSDVGVIIDIEGRFLRGALEHSVSQLDPCNTEDLFGGFLQMAGLRVRYDLREPVGSRVVSVDALCTQCLVPKYEPLEDDAVYRVGLSSFIANGGDGYSVIADNIIRTEVVGAFDFTLFAGLANFGPIFPALEGRIRFVDGSDKCQPPPTPKRGSVAVPRQKSKSGGRYP